MTYFDAAGRDNVGGADTARPDDNRPDFRQWTIKGLDPTVVEKARAAARKRGMKINAWVAATLEDAAERQLEGVEPAGHSPLSIDIGEIVAKIEQGRHEERLLIEKIEKDISQLVRGQHGIMTELFVRGGDQSS